ncbi:MAG: dethiobiotin synthase [Magnetococcales bacterium]|nr:dethiobiotin synthase [Magnetococcales bacterium]
MPRFWNFCTKRVEGAFGGAENFKNQAGSPELTKRAGAASLPDSQTPFNQSRNVGFFVTGTDTDVGKTVATAWLLRRLRGFYWKPIQAGLDGETDTMVVQRLAELPDHHVIPTRHALHLPRSPHLAAARENITIHLTDFHLANPPQPLVVEGAGGLLVPINQTALMVDLMARLRLPVIVVARTSLGTINHTLLTLETLRHRGLTVAGVILNGPPDTSNREAIIHYGRVDILAEIPFLETLTGAELDRAAVVHPSAVVVLNSYTPCSKVDAV